jgi:hypothetical protein
MNPPACCRLSLSFPDSPRSRSARINHSYAVPPERGQRILHRASRRGPREGGHALKRVAPLEAPARAADPACTAGTPPATSRLNQAKSSQIKPARDQGTLSAAEFERRAPAHGPVGPPMPFRRSYPPNSEAECLPTRRAAVPAAATLMGRDVWKSSTTLTRPRCCARGRAHAGTTWFSWRSPAISEFGFKQQFPERVLLRP